MTEQMKKITDYEKRLLEDRKWLSELLEENNGTDSELVKKRLEHFSAEVSYMEKQLGILKKQAEERAPEVIGENLSVEKVENVTSTEHEQAAVAKDKGVEIVGVTAPGTPKGDGQAFATSNKTRNVGSVSDS